MYATLAEAVHDLKIRLCVLRNGSIWTVYPAIHHAPNWFDLEHPFVCVARLLGHKCAGGQTIQAAPWNAWAIENAGGLVLPRPEVVRATVALRGRDGSDTRHKLELLAVQ